MANNIILTRLSIKDTDGWVALATDPMVADVTLHCLSTAISMRVGKTGTAVTMQSAQYRMEGIDLSQLEISTTSTVPLGFIVIGNTRGPRS